MGIFAGRWKCATEKCGAVIDIKNPDPNRFELIRFFEEGPYLLVTVHYPNATNYEGRKTILFKDMKAIDFRSVKRLDPHFDPMSRIIARFEPTEAGWHNGLTLMHVLTKEINNDSTSP